MQLQRGERLAVEVGQVWADNDRRLGRQPKARRVTIEEVTSTHAIVRNVATGRKTWIQLKRFRPNSTGYQLLGPGPGRRG